MSREYNGVVGEGNEYVIVISFYQFGSYRLRKRHPWTSALVNKQLNSYFDWLCIFLGSSFIYTVKDSTYSFLLRVLILHPCRHGRLSQ